MLHACSEDLEVLLRLTGKLPQPLFDTQLAAGYLNIGFSMGYSRLVQEVLGLELPKGETCLTGCSARCPRPRSATPPKMPCTWPSCSPPCARA